MRLILTLLLLISAPLFAGEPLCQCEHCLKLDNGVTKLCQSPFERGACPGGWTFLFAPEGGSCAFLHRSVAEGYYYYDNFPALHLCELRNCGPVLSPR